MYYLKLATSYHVCFINYITFNYLSETLLISFLFQMHSGKLVYKVITPSTHALQKTKTLIKSTYRSLTIFRKFSKTCIKFVRGFEDKAA